VINLAESEAQQSVVIKWKSRSCVMQNVILNAAKETFLVWNDNQTHSHMRLKDWKNLIFILKREDHGGKQTTAQSFRFVTKTSDFRNYLKTSNLMLKH